MAISLRCAALRSLQLQPPVATPAAAHAADKPRLQAGAAAASAFRLAPLCASLPEAMGALTLGLGLSLTLPQP